MIGSDAYSLLFAKCFHHDLVYYYDKIATDPQASNNPKRSVNDIKETEDAQLIDSVNPFEQQDQDKEADAAAPEVGIEDNSSHEFDSRQNDEDTNAQKNQD